MSQARNLKQHTRRLLGLLLSLSFLGMVLMPATAYAADSASITLSPSASSVQVGNAISVSVTITSTTYINLAQAYITYDASKLDYVSSPCSAALPGDSPGKSASSGVVTLACTKLGGPFPTGTVSLGTVNLKARADAVAGTAAIGITKAQSYVYESTTNTEILAAGNVNGTSFSITPIPPAAPTAQPTSKSTKTTTPAKPAAAKPAVITPNTSLTPDPGPEPVVVTPVVSTPVKTVAVVTKKKSPNYAAIVGSLVVVGLIIAGGLFFGRKMMGAHAASSVSTGMTDGGVMGAEEATNMLNKDAPLDEKLNSLDSDVPRPDSVIKPSESDSSVHSLDGPDQKV